MTSVEWAGSSGCAPKWSYRMWPRELWNPTAHHGLGWVSHILCLRTQALRAPFSHHYSSTRHETPASRPTHDQSQMPSPDGGRWAREFLPPPEAAKAVTTQENEWYESGGNPRHTCRPTWRSDCATTKGMLPLKDWLRSGGYPSQLMTNGAEGNVVYRGVPTIGGGYVQNSFI